MEKRDAYGIYLADGNIVEPELRDRLWPKGVDGSKGLEHAMAQHVHRSGQNDIVGGPVHVWVVGAPGWLEDAPDLIRRMAGEDSDDAYRILIVGNAGHLVGGYKWGDYAGRRFFVHRKKGAPGFRRSASEIVGAMRTYWDTTQSHPSPVLDALGVPYAFVGDESMSREEGTE